jgi:hypothetical protein
VKTVCFGGDEYGIDWHTRAIGESARLKPLGSGNPVVEANLVNAEKANTLGTVTVTAAKGFRFGTQAANDSAGLLAA